ncbi:MAG: SUMF1/EgtB/PvdO family nonheme iron enzyme [Gemmatimonadota bacterium]
MSAPQRWAVPLAALGLVGAVWISLEVAREAPAAERAPLPPGGSFDDPRFRADAWMLPADGALGFVEIPAGPFRMGSDPTADGLSYDIERWTPEEPQGVVDLPTFWIGRFEVTVAQYRAFVEATGHRATDPTPLQAPPDHPVTSVSWPDALAYARWLEGELRASATTPATLRARLDEGWRLTLPSEAQWEKAARGPDGRIYPWGSTPDTAFATFGRRGPSPVGTHPCPACPYDGLADLSGNVWEWTRSPYQPYPFDPSDDTATADEDALWVMRGGSFADDARNVRAAVRGGADPGARRPFLGFRLVLTPP